MTSAAARVPTDDRVAAAIADARVELLGLSHSIHAEPELAFEEHKSSAKVAELLRGHGFEVRTGVAGLDTAFVAEYGSGDLVLAFCAEYDALPEVGHACGHNIIAASSAGAGIGLAAAADELGVSVRVIGTPAEETGGGKILMLESGVFDDVAAAMMVHPGPQDIAGATSLALADIAVTYRGKEAHAAAAPELGRNAADAVTVAQVGLGLLRQHLTAGQQVHGIVSDGGVAPNIVPAHTEMLYYLRAPDEALLADLERRAGDCFAAGALATGCEHAIRTVSPPYAELTPDRALVDVYRDVVHGLGRRPIPPEAEAAHPLGSTDMGNISKVLPSLHPVIGIESGGAVTHQPEFAAACRTDSADRAVLDGATALARTALRAATDGELRRRLIELVERRDRR